ncbi:MAG: D-aminoacyl-tRNA deacylase, partial [Lentisphaeria bacterium]|nr:D-aminoacyl-tRNA deacylase [Lentisphaeria bacterium]
MRALLQRVTEAAVKVDGENIGSCGNGLLILLGVCNGDSREEAAFLAEKCLNLRIFADDEGKMNRSLLDIQG